MPIVTVPFETVERALAARARARADSFLAPGYRLRLKYGVDTAGAAEVYMIADAEAGRAVCTVLAADDIDAAVALAMGLKPARDAIALALAPAAAPNGAVVVPASIDVTAEDGAVVAAKVGLGVVTVGADYREPGTAAAVVMPAVCPGPTPLTVVVGGAQDAPVESAAAKPAPKGKLAPKGPAKPAAGGKAAIPSRAAKSAAPGKGGGPKPKGPAKKK